MKKSLASLVIALAAAQPALAQDIVIGPSVALSGPNADIGRDMRDGALAVFAKVNANNRQRATENTQRLLGQHAAMVLFGYNSATNSLDSLPLVAQNNKLFFAPFSGSTKLRGHPNVSPSRAAWP